MQGMGHEISYHYDVMDSCKGDLDKAVVEYAENVALFEAKRFSDRYRLPAQKPGRQTRGLYVQSRFLPQQTGAGTLP